MLISANENTQRKPGNTLPKSEGNANRWDRAMKDDAILKRRALKLAFCHAYRQ